MFLSIGEADAGDHVADQFVTIQATEAFPGGLLALVGLVLMCVALPFIVFLGLLVWVSF
ncbi:hypothetical protein ACERK3_10720 [Phycisphaerales bacterium AB-hyl4]|uniref:Uncharacterized protein n=1 Tax=Natronomicrosphaera hydrolytica TaxID=3242702 RepID=A0ABV4U7H3_9BACT